MHRDLTVLLYAPKFINVPLRYCLHCLINVSQKQHENHVKTSLWENPY